MQSKNDLLEKTDYDIWPRYLAQDYIKDDRAVMQSGKSLINKIELISNRDGSLNWYSTNKVPLYNKAKLVVGVAGFATDLKRTEESIKPLLVMEPAVNYIMNHYAENIQIKNLAGIMGLSVSALERRFKKQLGETPLKYINKIRIAAVCRLLATSRESISKIAMNTGFYDSSHFTRQFIKYTGKSPSAYRKLYQEI